MATFERPAVPEEFKPFKFSRIIPSLEVDSLERSIDFYTTQLPFYLSGRDGINHCWLTLHGSTAMNHYTGLEQGSVNIYLRRKGFVGPGELQPLPAGQERKGLIYIRMDGSEALFGQLYQTLKSKGTTISQELMTTPWGSSKFALHDLDQNEICFYIMNKPGSKA